MQFFAHDCTKVIHSFQHSNPRPTPSEARQKIVLQTSNTMYKRQVRETQRERKQCIATYRAKCRHLPREVQTPTKRSEGTYQTMHKHPFYPTQRWTSPTHASYKGITSGCPTASRQLHNRHLTEGIFNSLIQTDISHSPSPMTHAP